METGETILLLSNILALTRIGYRVADFCLRDSNSLYHFLSLELIVTDHGLPVYH